MKRPLKVLSASLGVILIGQMLLLSAHAAESPSPGAGSSKLVEWSSEDVKAYYDPSVDWSLPVPVEKSTTSPSPSQAPAAGGTAPIIVNQVSGGSGFGWDDLLLYHLIFNTVSPYSSNNWGSSHRSYYYRSNTPYVTKTYQPSTFSNKSTTKTPTTSSGTGTFTSNKSSSGNTTGTSSSVNSSGTTSGGTTSKSTSTSSGSIGGKSSGFSSSSSSSSGG